MKISYWFNSIELLRGLIVCCLVLKLHHKNNGFIKKEISTIRYQNVGNLTNFMKIDSKNK